MANFLRRYGRFQTAGQGEQALGGTISAIGSDIMEEVERAREDQMRLQLNAENAGYTRNMLKWDNEIEKQKQTFKDEPSQLTAWYKENLPNMEKDVLSAVNPNKKIQTAFKQQFDEDSLKIEGELNKWSMGQQAQNDTINYRVFLDNSKMPQNYQGSDGFDKLMRNLDTTKKTMFGFYGTKKINGMTNDKMKADFTDSIQSQISSYLLQSGDETLINNPNAFIEGINTKLRESEQGPSYQFPEKFYDEDEILELKKRYESNKSFAESQAKKALEAKQNEVLSQAQDYALKKDFKGGIDTLYSARDTLGAEWFNDAIPKFQRAFEIFDKTGENLFDSRYTIKFAEIREGIINGTANEKEIRNWTGKEDGYGITQEDYLLKLLNGKESKVKAFEDSVAGKYFEEMIQDWGKDWVLPETNINMLRERGFRLLQDEIEAADPPLTDRQKKEATLRIFNNIKNEQITTEPEFLLTPKELEERKYKGTSSGRTYGLEEIWDELDFESQKAALGLLAKGATPEQLIAHFKKKKK